MSEVSRIPQVAKSTQILAYCLYQGFECNLYTVIYKHVLTAALFSKSLLKK